VQCLYWQANVSVNRNIVTMTSWTPQLDPQLPRYLAIAQAIAADLQSGRLSPGDKLPTHRELAWQLGVTVGTVTRAYQEAERRGLLSGEVGRGSFLRDPLAGRRAAVTAGERGPLDLQAAVPPRVCDQADFDQALMRLMADPSRLDHLDYPPVAGLPEHRDMARSWLRRAGVDVPASQIALTSGAQHGLLAILATVARPGDSVLVEPLTYPTVQPIARQLGLRLQPLEADGDGILPDSLDRAVAAGPGRIVYLVPTLHNPTTIVLSEERRRAIAAIARAHSLTIIEDDIFRLLLPEAPPTLQSLAPERCWYISSLSKTVAPGLRIGFVAAPPRQIDNLLRTMFATGGRAVGITAHIAQGWVEAGVAQRILGSIRAELQSRRAAALSALEGLPVQCTEGSPFAWITLPDYWRPIEFVSAALGLGIKLSPGDAFAVDRTVPSSGVRLCFGGAPSLPLLVQACDQLVRLAGEEPVAQYQAMP
jgi:DNA-binding transcriptional MocR family regulator